MGDKGNCRIKPVDDTLPKRFTYEPLKEGASKGQVVPVDRMVKEYYVGQRLESRWRTPGFRRQMTENRGQGTDGRRQSTDDR